MKKVWAILVNWNRPNDTLGCVRSLLLNKDGFDLKVLIVDNASSDNSVKMLSRAFSKNKEIKMLKSNKNLGFTGGNNLGIKYAIKSGAEYLLIINNDTVTDKNLVKNLLETFDNYPNLGIASPKIYFSPGFEYHKEYKKSELGKVIWYAGGVIDWDNVYGKNWGVDEVDLGQFDREKEIDFATGACMMVRKDLIKKIGEFNDKYFAYMEDVEFSQRVKRSGFKIVFNPKAFLWHKVSQSSGIGSELNDYYITRNRLLFGLKYAKLKTKLALLKEALTFLQFGRPWQKKGVLDYAFGNLGKGSFK